MNCINSNINIYLLIFRKILKLINVPKYYSLLKQTLPDLINKTIGYLIPLCIILQLSSIGMLNLSSRTGTEFKVLKPF